MKFIISFSLVVMSMALELWTGCFRKNTDFYDRHATTRTKIGYMLFLVSALSAVTLLTFWITMQIDK
ncbi:hypothetical protein QPK24_15005 [Paenibacillus polygoni]|uniref:Immunity protein 17 n=1 Tax=Paenibacillus polygoni TaxID=3050112 RepID=A0ABY8WZX1_9BACL|nr:hypothetical protein [Paenibacillus polygoni]WIV17727.1 hypothetical protein QPK24_15005 [Paenibacillus polygoni]